MQNRISYSDQLWEKAQTFYHDYYQTEGLGSPTIRMAQIKAEIDREGSYWQTTEELEYGAKIAWRNSNRCIGRLHWKSLKVRDQRHLQKEQEIFEALVEHLDLATNSGKIRPYISIFRSENTLRNQSIRLWNSQLIHYAGYKQDGQIIGDPSELEFTAICQQLGWKGQGTAYDVLPLVLQINHKKPQLFEIPSWLILEVPIEHPFFSWFGALGIKWYAVPAIADMVLEIGGLHYTCAPFNGWYMLTEIAARNLSDVKRYNFLPLIAKELGLNTSDNKSLWKDRALLELNIAVFHSFAKQNVSLVDHHTAAEQFIYFDEQEKRSNREVQADWPWIVPPMSPSTTPVFHETWSNKVVSPNFFYNSPPWKKDHAPIPPLDCPFHLSRMQNNP